MPPTENSPQAEGNGKRYVEVQRGTVDSLLVCEITDYEWENIKKGMPANPFLTFGVALLSMGCSLGCSFLIALLTTNIESLIFIVVFTVIFTGGFVGGIVLMSLWWRDRRSIDPLVKKIEHRFDKAVKPTGRDKGAK